MSNIENFLVSGKCLAVVKMGFINADIEKLPLETGLIVTEQLSDS